MEKERKNNKKREIKKRRTKLLKKSSTLKPKDVIKMQIQQVIKEEKERSKGKGKGGMEEFKDVDIDIWGLTEGRPVDSCIKVKSEEGGKKGKRENGKGKRKGEGKGKGKGQGQEKEKEKEKAKDSRNGKTQGRIMKEDGQKTVETAGQKRCTKDR